MFRHEYQTAIERDSSASSITLSYQSDDLMEKLKQLNYEKLLLREMKMKQLHRFYFVRSTNSGEQFFMFISIAAWLIRKTGREFEPPQEFDDPNVIISKIIKVLQEMDIQTDFPTTKLILGAGPICIYILDCLAQQALKSMKIVFKTPDIKQEDTTLLDTMDNDQEVILEKVEELNAFVSDESDDEHGSIFGTHLNLPSGANVTKNTQKEYNKLETVTSNEEWRLELERVLPTLKIVVKADSRDWRAHLEQMKVLRKNISSASEETQSQLKKLKSDISLALEKIDSREKHLNTDLKQTIQTYKQISSELNQLTTQIRENDQKKGETEQNLFKISNELDNIKIQMEQRGNTMTDGSPLINIKKAIYKVKEEIQEMDIKIGIMQHTLNTEIMKQGSNFTDYEPISLMT